MRSRRASARRDYHKGVLEKFLERIEKDAPRLRRLSQILHRLQMGYLPPVGRFTRDLDVQSFKGTSLRLLGFNPEHTDVEPAVRSMFRQDPALMKAYKALVDAAREADGVLQMTFDEVKGGRTSGADLERVRQAVTLAIERTLDFRITSENFIYK